MTFRPPVAAERHAVAAAALGAAAVGSSVLAGGGSWGRALGFAALVGVALLVSAPTLEERSWTLAPGVLVAILHLDEPEVAAGLVLAGLVIGGAAAAADRRRLVASTVRYQHLALALVGLGGGYGAAYALFGDTGGGWEAVAAAGLSALAWLAADGARFTLVPQRQVTGLWLSQARAALVDVPHGLVMVATGALAAIAWDGDGALAALVATSGYVLAFAAFTELPRARTRYRRTLHALSKLPEVARLAPLHHGDLTAGYAVAIGREMGMGRRQLRQLEQAALLHEVGRVALRSAGGSGTEFSRTDVARWSAEIVGQSLHLRSATRTIRSMYDPYRRPGEARTEGLARSSRITRVACEYERLLRAALSPLEALERLREQSVYEYDPLVLDALWSSIDRADLASGAAP